MGDAVRDGIRAYSVFDLTPTSSLEEVKQKRKELVLRYHPDKLRLVPSGEEYGNLKMKEINEAYEIIKNFNLRTSSGGKNQRGNRGTFFKQYHRIELTFEEAYNGCYKEGLYFSPGFFNTKTFDSSIYNICLHVHPLYNLLVDSHTEISRVNFSISITRTTTETADFEESFTFLDNTSFTVRVSAPILNGQRVEVPNVNKFGKLFVEFSLIRPYRQRYQSPGISSNGIE